MVNPVQLAKPASSNGKDRSKFRAWWQQVNTYIETYPEEIRINWVWSLFTDYAQSVHQTRQRTLSNLGVQDTWDAYTREMRKKFTDPAKSDKSEAKTRELKYKGACGQWLSLLACYPIGLELLVSVHFR